MARMKSKGRALLARVRGGMKALSARDMGRSSILAAAVAPFFAARSPAAALIFILLPAYWVLMKGDFSGARESALDEPSVALDAGRRAEIPARLLGALLAALASFAALAVGNTLALRFGMAAFKSPWGLGLSAVCASLLLCAVHLPFLALRGFKAARSAGGISFAALGALAALSALRRGSLYGAFLWLVYSGQAPALYPPLLALSAVLALAAGAASWKLSAGREAAR